MTSSSSTSFPADLTSIPWVAALISSPDFRAIPSPIRNPKASTEDSLLAETLQTSNTIRTWSSFHRPPSATRAVGEVRTILAFGSGVNGHPHVAHGGLLATVLDELMIFTAGLWEEGMKGLLTVSLSVRYKRRVETPGMVLVRTWVDRREGRRVYARGTVENGNGGVLVEAEGVFVQSKERL